MYNVDIYSNGDNNHHGTNIDQLDLSISKLGDKINTHDVVIVGDFNTPNVDWDTLTSTYRSGYSKADAEKLINLTVDHGLTQCVTEATRRQGETESILDLVLTNNPDCIEKITLSDGIADHMIMSSSIWILLRRPSVMLAVKFTSAKRQTLILSRRPWKISRKSTLIHLVSRT